MAERDIPASDRICKCGHPGDRHLSDGLKLSDTDAKANMANNQTWCFERFCPCSKFVLHNVK